MNENQNIFSQYVQTDELVHVCFFNPLSVCYVEDPGENRKCVSYLQLNAQRGQNSSSVRIPQHFPLDDKIRERKESNNIYIVLYNMNEVQLN